MIAYHHTFNQRSSSLSSSSLRYTSRWLSSSPSSSYSLRSNGGFY